MFRVQGPGSRKDDRDPVTSRRFHSPDPRSQASNPTPYTLYPTPYTLNPTPYTLHLHPTPYTLHPTPYTLHSTICTLHPTPYALHPTLYTLRPPPWNFILVDLTLQPGNLPLCCIHGVYQSVRSPRRHGAELRRPGRILPSEPLRW